MKSKFLKKIIAIAVVGTSISTFVSPNAFAAATNDFYAWQNMNSGQSNGNWKLNSGKWYFYNYSGTMQTGWIYDKGKWYYADYTGVMQTGVIQINGKIHFFSESGAMQIGNAVINGKYYSFDGNGVAVGKDIPTPINSFDLSGSTTVPYTPQIITNEDSSPSDPNTVARDPDNLIKYNVKFKDDDGDEFSTKTIEKDQKLTLYKPSKSGYTFVEWTTKKDGDGDSYEAGESITIKKDITLYAQWKESSTSDPGTSTDKVAVEDVTVTSTAGSTTVGGTLTMTAKVLPINATEKGITWSVSDAKVASISADGVLTANAVGTVMVVATSKDASGAFGSTSIEVKVVAGAAITGLDGELQMGATVIATAATTEAGASNWTSSNKTVAEVNPSTGVVTAKAAGTTTIAYTTSTSGNVNTKVITVKAISVGAEVTGLDEALQMETKETATAKTTEAGAGKWKSSNELVATVDETSGFVTAKAAGYTTISYTYSTSGKTNLKVLTVKAAAVLPGEPITLDAELQMGKTVTAAAVTIEKGADKWKSSDKSVATVGESTGVVTALKAGYTTISYTYSTSGKVNSKDIIVKNAEVVDNLPTAAPTINGIAVLGQTLTANPVYSDLDNDTQSGTTYAFYRYDADGASGETVVQAASTTKTYLIKLSDVGKVIKVKVIPKNAKGTGVQAVSSATAIIEAKEDNLPTAVPTISGAAEIGKTLTAISAYADADKDVEAGTTYEFWRYDSDGTSNPGQVQAPSTTATYVVKPADEGKVIKVKVVPKNTRGTGIEVVSAGTVIDNLPTALPKIVGTAKVGEILTVSSGYVDADNDPDEGTTYAFYRYDADGISNPVLASVQASTTKTYVIQAADAGKVIKVKVVPKNAKGTGSEVVSLPTGVIAQTVAPTVVSVINITGTAQVGSVLTASGLSPVGATVNYQWKISIDGTTYTDIAGATANTYTSVTGDAGKYIKVSVTGTGSYTGTATSTQTAAVQAAPVAVANATVTGTATVSETLTAAANVGATNVTYAWYASATNDNINGVIISGATASTYVLKGSEQGKYVYVVINGDNSSTATSTQTAAVQAAPVAVTNATVTGTATVSETLTAAANVGATNVTYAWYASATNDNTNGVIISGATASTYVLKGSEQGKYVYVVINGDNSSTATSTQTAVVQAAPVAVANATVTGTATVSETLTAAANVGATNVTYAWYASATNDNTNGVIISGATASTYVLTGSEQDKYVYVVIKGDNSSTATSTQTASVQL